MKKNWHSIPIEEAFAAARSAAAGLTNEEAEKRLKKFGPNILPSEKPYSKIRLLLRQFNNPLIYILLVAVAISLFLKHYSDSVFIIIILFINTLVGFYQENKANRSVAALKQMVKIRAWVLRDGNEKEIDSEELVIGDIVLIKAGDKMPADGRIIKSKNLKINEASLTGEWLATDKKPETLSENIPLAERSNMAFMGSIIENGWAEIVVVGTGINTQIGDVVSLIKETEERQTPLQQKIVTLSRWIGGFIIAVVLAIVVIGYATGQSFADIFLSALALSASAIPVGLLPAVTIILALGMRRILRHKGLVRKLVANETLGGVTVIATDKTGTLTEGKMQVSHILTSGRELMSDKFDGVFKNGGNGLGSHIMALKIATLANDAFIENPEDDLKKWIVRGRPTEQALLLAGVSAGLNKRELEKQYPVLDRINFDTALGYSATFHKLSEKEDIFYIAGSPEKIIEKSENLDIDGQIKKIKCEETNALMDKLEQLTGKGLRVLAFAYRNYGAGIRYKELNDLARGLTLVGFIALKDPLRPDAKKAIAVSKKAGIRTVIVTGDHKLTAKAIAEEIGLKASAEQILEGKELESVSDEKLKEMAKYISIYARVSPRHKLRIVSALQANGEVVAMFGDGVNDAPALKAADVGVALGSGTDVAKEVSDIVLLDNGFGTIIKAIEQGRVIFENIRKVFIYLVADDFSEIFLFLSSVALGLPLPLLPAQILWINLVEDGLPDIALTMEQETDHIMEEKPRSPKESIVNGRIKIWIAVIFLITGLMAFSAFYIMLKITGDLEKTRTIIFALMALDSLTFAYNVRSFKKTIFRSDILSNKYLNGAVVVSFALLLVAVYFPPLQNILGTTPLFFKDWGIIFILAATEMALIAASKKIFFKF